MTDILIQKDKIHKVLFNLVRQTVKATEHYYGGEPSAERKGDWQINLDGETDYALKEIIISLHKIKDEAKREAIERIKTQMIKNPDGILLSNGDDRFIELHSFLEMLNSLKEEGEKWILNKHYTKKLNV